MTHEKKTKKRLSGDERKSQIVRIATQLFAKNGFKGTTTREIARKAGISEAVIFKHFSKKEGLYKAIIDSRCDDDSGQSRLLGRLKGMKGKELFREVASYMLSEHQKDSSFMRLLTFSALEKQNLSEMFIRSRGFELIEFIEGHIKQLIAEGSFRQADSAIAARGFVGMVLHFSMAQELYGLKRYFKRPNDQVADTFVEIFFEGMMRR